NSAGSQSGRSGSCLFDDNLCMVGDCHLDIVEDQVTEPGKVAIHSICYDVEQRRLPCPVAPIEDVDRWFQCEMEIRATWKATYVDVSNVLCQGCLPASSHGA